MVEQVDLPMMSLKPVIELQLPSSMDSTLDESRDKGNEVDKDRVNWYWVSLVWLDYSRKSR